jgi:hypothetical protein
VCPHNCLSCEDKNLDGVLVCTTCSNRFILNNGVCGSCPVNCATCTYVSEYGLRCGTCKSRYTFDTDNNCVACPANCGECTWDAAEGKVSESSPDHQLE